MYCDNGVLFCVCRHHVTFQVLPKRWLRSTNTRKNDTSCRHLRRSQCQVGSDRMKTIYCFYLKMQWKHRLAICTFGVFFSSFLCVIYFSGGRRKLVVILNCSINVDRFANARFLDVGMIVVKLPMSYDLIT